MLTMEYYSAIKTNKALLYIYDMDEPENMLTE